MTSFRPSCIKCVDEPKCVKNGKDRIGKQRFICKKCKTSFVESYRYQAYKPSINNKIVILLKEGCGIRSISRILRISAHTVLSRIKKISRQVKKPRILFNKTYEVDEMCTYIKEKTKKVWIVYALRKDTREVVDFVIGPRTKTTLNIIVSALQLFNAQKIFTDKLNIYQILIDKKVHSTKFRGINYIERNHLTIRTRIKRLNRKTICYSKSLSMLQACLTIYFWG